MCLHKWKLSFSRKSTRKRELKMQDLPGPALGPWTPANIGSLHSPDYALLLRKNLGNIFGPPTKSWIRYCTVLQFSNKLTQNGHTLCTRLTYTLMEYPTLTEWFGNNFMFFVILRHQILTELKKYSKQLFPCSYTTQN